MSEKAVIYGITEQPFRGDVQAWAIDGETGEPISSHVSSNDLYAKHDLGFADTPIEESEGHHKRNHEIYAAKYPQGYEMVWIGNYDGNRMISDLIGKYCASQKSKTDDKATV